jgi:hypothetical protein
MRQQKEKAVSLIIEYPDGYDMVEAFKKEEIKAFGVCEIIKLTIKFENPKQSYIVFQLIFAFISSLETEDPTKVHFDIVRATLNKIDPKLLADKGIIDSVARNLIACCAKLKSKIAESTPKQILNLIISTNKKAQAEKFTPESGKVPLEFVIADLKAVPNLDKIFEKDGMFSWDKFLLDILDSTGENGAKAAKDLKDTFRKKFKISQTEGNSPLHFWFNSNSPTPEEPFHISPALQILAGCIYHDLDAINKKLSYGTMRVGGHMADQELAQKNKFVPSPKMKQNIIDLGQWEQIHAGLTNLSVLEHKAITALHVILHQKSQTVNPEADDFYVGNEVPKVIKTGETELISPVIRFTKHEYYKAFTGKEDYSGKEQKTADKALASLAPRKFLIILQRKKRVQLNEKQEYRFDRIELYDPLFRVITVFRDLTNKQKDLVNSGDKATRKRKGEEIFALNPIFRDQIDTKYLRYPIDLTRRIRKASNDVGCKEAPSTYCLITYLTREHSSKHYNPEISEQVLIKYLELEKMESEGRQKRIRERIDNDIKIAIGIGLIERYERVSRKNPNEGQKYIFYLNPKWPEVHPQNLLNAKK